MENSNGVTLYPPVGNLLAKFRIRQDEENLSNFFKSAMQRGGQIISSVIVSVFFVLFGISSIYTFLSTGSTGELVYGIVILILGGFIMNSQVMMPGNYAKAMLATTPSLKYQLDLSIYDGGIFLEYFTGAFRYTWDDVYMVVLSKYGLTILFGQNNGFLISNESLQNINHDQMNHFFKERLQNKFVVK